MPSPPRRRPSRPPRPPAPPSGLQRVVLALCHAEGWPAPIHECRFAPPRLWRFDLAWPEARLAVEIQGGIFTRGRHVRGASLLREWEKLNTAALMGWAVLLVSTDQVTDGTLRNLLALAILRRYDEQDGLRLMLAGEDVADPVRDGWVGKDGRP
jgi:hypothetical protein